MLNLDSDNLEKKFYELSRQYHPDFHTESSHEKQEEVLQMTATLNDAYRTLKEPTKRAEYLLESRGFEIDRSKVPQTLLMEVFEINEELEQIRSGRESGGNVDDSIEQLKEFHEEIANKRITYNEELCESFTRWDALILSGASEKDCQEELISLCDIISRASYIRNLERDIEKEVCP